MSQVKPQQLQQQPSSMPHPSMMMTSSAASSGGFPSSAVATAAATTTLLDEVQTGALPSTQLHATGLSPPPLTPQGAPLLLAGTTAPPQYHPFPLSASLMPQESRVSDVICFTGKQGG